MKEFEREEMLKQICFLYYVAENLKRKKRKEVYRAIRHLNNVLKTKFKKEKKEYVN